MPVYVRMGNNQLLKFLRPFPNFRDHAENCERRGYCTENDDPTAVHCWTPLSLAQRPRPDADSQIPAALHANGNAGASSVNFALNSIYFASDLKNAPYSLSYAGGQEKLATHGCLGVGAFKSP